MRFVLGVGLAVALVSFSAVASADDATATGIELGLRTGYSLPLGSVGNAATTAPAGSAQSLDMSTLFSGRLPIWLDAGYRITPNIYVGAFFQYGIVFPASNATTGCGNNQVSCSGHDLQFGVGAHFHFLPDEVFDPWAGLGIGYESATLSQSVGTQSGDTTVSGFQFLNLQLGGDYKAMPNLGIGPFVSLSLGEYSSASVTAGAQSVSADIPNKALHEWLTFGVRGAYDINL